MLVRSMNLEHLFANTLSQCRPRRHSPFKAKAPVTPRESWRGQVRGFGVIERKRRISGHPRLLQTRLAPFSKVSVKFLAK